MKIFFEKSDFDEVKKCGTMRLEEKLSVIADMIRLNALNTIMCAKSGHIGASFSAVEILTVLYHWEMKINPANPKTVDRDIFILSKGHAAAALYSTLASRGFFPTERLATFRSLNGLEGHAEISAPGVETNTGSLGMGISKAKGFALSTKLDGVKRSVYVLVGDGELQEGQNWEAILSAAQWKLDNLYLLIDRNRVQTDMPVEKVVDISPLREKLKSFGWHVEVTKGHDIGKLLGVLKRIKRIKGKPKAVILDTIKGKGVSFMEHPVALKAGKGFYKWHDKLPLGEDYREAWEEIATRIKGKLSRHKIPVVFPVFRPELAEKPPKVGESLVEAFSRILVEAGKRKKELVVLDADLAESCGLREFQMTFPERFVEVGISEQDMVSTASGLALAGKLPVVNTYAAFLTSRANEQIFNNCSEGSKVVYVGHLAGILPAKPGKSHQGIRDIALLRNIPNLLLCAPSCGEELRRIFEFLVFDHDGPSYLRLEHNIPRVQIPWKEQKLELGRGVELADGDDAVMIGYGPTMLSEALIARQMLEEDRIKVKIIDLPWLSRIEEEWLLGETGDIETIVCLENHSVKGGLSEELSGILGRKIYTIGVGGYGRSGENGEILSHFGLDAESIRRKVKGWLRK